MWLLMPWRFPLAPSFCGILLDLPSVSTRILKILAGAVHKLSCDQKPGWLPDTRGLDNPGLENNKAEQGSRRQMMVTNPSS